jgi:hypothetical protein
MAYSTLVLRTAIAACVLTLGLLQACGPGDPDQILYQARQDQASENFRAALEGYERILVHERSNEEQKFQAFCESVICLARVGKTDGDVIEVFDWMVQDHSDRLDLDTVLRLSSELGESDRFDAALLLLGYADERYAERDSEAKARIEDLARQLFEAGDYEQPKVNLQQLAYLQR